jgi:hypothetical protein
MQTHDDRVSAEANVRRRLGALPGRSQNRWVVVRFWIITMMLTPAP